jgi:formylglycine-generating enzyme required for sulfatase activity
MTPDRLRIFLSSPGDVSRERARAIGVIERIESELAYRDWLRLEVVAWDKRGAGTPMPAHLEPQEAINEGLCRPSECDIVVVIFGARMGTRLSERHKKPDGSRYRSGTEYEYLDAVTAADKTGTPMVLVYRCEEAPSVSFADPEFEAKKKQWRLVEEFFAEFRNDDGSLRRSFKTYKDPSDFERQLDDALRSFITRRRPVKKPEKNTAVGKSEEPVWEGEPFPGLRPFHPEEAPIFFGRGREADGLVQRLSDPRNRFIAVVGASGSGKSSLVAAGLLPALRKGAIPGSQDWSCARFTPGGSGNPPNPFLALANAFDSALHGRGRRPSEVAEDLEEDPEKGLHALAGRALESRPDWAEILLFIDQFEELLTLVPLTYRRSFADLLSLAAKTPRVRTVVTLRADFYHHCLGWDKLNELFVEEHYYPLLAPKAGGLHEMITRPADRAGLKFEEGLAQRILDDTGTEPGALALMAFTLFELYGRSKATCGALTNAAYDAFGGVHGAIGRRAEETFNAIDGESPVLDAALAHLFKDLVEVDERGVATRRRALRREVTGSAAKESLVSALTEARLLITGRGESNEPTVEVAHEAIFRSWPRLAAWIEAYGDDLRLRRQITQAADQWEAKGKKDKYLWPDERVTDVKSMLERLDLGMEDFSETERCFLGPIEVETMLAELDDPGTDHRRRALIGVRLALLGDPRPGVGLREDGLPDIAWCEVPAGEITLERDRATGLRGLFGSKARAFRVEPFLIAKYPLTSTQYRAFLEAGDGYGNPEWWQNLAFRSEKPGRQFNAWDNHPAENLAWVEAVVFCRWLTARLGTEIRLPTEWEWQQAATGGDPTNEYPWGSEWDPSQANTDESELGRSTAVGMYPQEASPIGALDMSGNVWEWCLNEYDNPGQIKLTGESRRVVRGGSWDGSLPYARAACRNSSAPASRDFSLGVRLACSSPI